MGNIHNTQISNIAVTVILAVLIVGAVMIPIINSVTESEIVTQKITNLGNPYLKTDGGEHTITLSLNGTEYEVDTDGDIMGTLDKTDDIVVGASNPFNCYYSAINLATGDNADDAGEERLSKQKGEVAYILNPNNLRQTQDGYTFDGTLYNIMLVIPPVYWYSNGTDKLYVASSPDAFDGLTLKDYAHTYTNGRTVGHTDAIAIGVYEAYNLNGVMVSQADREPMFSKSVPGSLSIDVSLTKCVSLANAGNTNSSANYRVWNFFDWTLYKIMCWTVMGNTDSQYMMGGGPASLPYPASPVVTGLTSSAYTQTPASDESSSVCLFLENSWGSASEWLGDTAVNNGTLIAGNALVQPTTASNVSNVLGETVTVPTSFGYYNTINTPSDAFGIASTVKSSRGTAGQGINDQYDGITSNNCAICVGGNYYSTFTAGLSFTSASFTWTDVSSYVGSRLACSFTGSGFATSPSQDDYAYVITYNNSNGVTITDVSVKEGEQTESKMPDGTTLNEYWGWKDKTDARDISDPELNGMNVALGENVLVKLYSNGYAYVLDPNGIVQTARITEDNSVVLTVTDNVAYTDNGGTARTTSPIAFIIGNGDYVESGGSISDSPVLLEDTEIWITTYTTNTMTSDSVGVQMGYVTNGTVNDLSTVLIAPVSTLTPANTETLVNVTEGDDDTVTFDSVTYRTAWGDSDSSEISVSSVIVPKEIQIQTEVEKVGTLGTIMGIIPVMILLSVIIGVASYMYNRDGSF